MSNWDSMVDEIIRDIEMSKSDSDMHVADGDQVFHKVPRGLTSRQVLKRMLWLVWEASPSNQFVTNRRLDDIGENAVWRIARTNGVLRCDNTHYADIDDGHVWGKKITMRAFSHRWSIQTPDDSTYTKDETAADWRECYADYSTLFEVAIFSFGPSDYAQPADIPPP